MGVCPFCGKEVEGPVHRGSVCPSCGRELRCCLACRFYSPGAHYDCREDVDEQVCDKERANFCEFFSLGAGPGGASAQERRKKDKAAFDRLFSF